MSSSEPRSLTATKSMSAPCCLGGPEEVAADAAEAVDADADGHRGASSGGRDGRTVGHPSRAGPRAPVPVRRAGQPDQRGQDGAEQRAGRGRGRAAGRRRRPPRVARATADREPAAGRATTSSGRRGRPSASTWAAHVVAGGLGARRPGGWRRRRPGRVVAASGLADAPARRPRPSTLVKSDPGPSTTWSARADGLDGHRLDARGSGGVHRRPRRCRRCRPTATWPWTSPTVVGADHGARPGRRWPGTTRARVEAEPAARATSSQAAARSAQRLGEAGEHEVADGVAGELAGVEAVLETPRPQAIVGVAERREAAAEIARGGDAERRRGAVRSTRRRRPSPPRR